MLKTFRLPITFQSLFQLAVILCQPTSTGKYHQKILFYLQSLTGASISDNKRTTHFICLILLEHNYTVPQTDVSRQWPANSILHNYRRGNLLLIMVIDNRLIICFLTFSVITMANCETRDPETGSYMFFHHFYVFIYSSNTRNNYNRELKQ